MRKAVYKNYKTGKYYTIVAGEGEGKTELRTVYIDDAKYDAIPVSVDKKGRVYKTIECETHITKNGFEVFKATV